MNIEWTDERPTACGCYVFKQKDSINLYVLNVHFGRWQEAQNPKYLYADKVLLEELECMWFGPIPEYKEYHDMDQPAVDLKQDHVRSIEKSSSPIGMGSYSKLLLDKKSAE